MVVAKEPAVRSGSPLYLMVASVTTATGIVNLSVLNTQANQLTNQF